MKAVTLDDHKKDFICTAGRKLAVRIDRHTGFSHFGLDSEGTGRETVNLLASPVFVSWSGCKWESAAWSQKGPRGWMCSIPCSGTESTMLWYVELTEEGMTWKFEYCGQGVINDFTAGFGMDPLLSSSVIIPASIDADKKGRGPWIFICTDFGQLMIDAEDISSWSALNGGQRGFSPGNAPVCGVDPAYRGKAWIEATNIQGFIPGKLDLRLSYEGQIKHGTVFTLRFTPFELENPGCLAPDIWHGIRRAYMNSWQPCGTWCDQDMAWVLSNNVLSDPASISLRSYAEPMLFYRNPYGSIDMLHLLRYSLEYWMDVQVSAIGHVNAFGRMYDLYPSAGCSIIDSAWVYWTVTHDREWLLKYMPKLHLMADYMLRRDVDDDGLLEDYSGGIEGMLRDPDRANIWFEMMNFGHKNTYFNLQAYRSLMCLSEMMEGIGKLKTARDREPLDTYIGRAGIRDDSVFLRGAAYYKGKAERLRRAFREKMHGKDGWFVSWIDIEGRQHDYCHTFINGLAVAYGMTDPDEGRQIMMRIAGLSASIGFKAWHLGVPANLIPCRRADLIQARTGMDGEPVRDSYYLSEDLKDEDLYGYRYPDGTIHPALVWPYLLGLQAAGLDDEADRILDAMTVSAKEGLFMNGIVNTGYGGAEHFYFNGMTCGYEGYLPESYNFLMAAFTSVPENREKLLGPLKR